MREDRYRFRDWTPPRETVSEVPVLSVLDETPDVSSPHPWHKDLIRAKAVEIFGSIYSTPGVDRASGTVMIDDVQYRVTIEYNA